MLTVQRPHSRHAHIHTVFKRPQVAPPAPASLVEHGGRRVIVVFAVMLAALLQTIDTTIVNVALPTIQGNLGASVDQGAWVLTAYVIANVVVIPLTPWLQRRFGRKRYFLASIVGFTAASVLCGFASTLPALIMFRVVQGAFGGGLLSTAQLILRDTFPPEQLGTSQSIFAFATIIGPSVGPSLGGIITDNLSWSWVFDINVLPGTLAALLLWRFLRDHGAQKREPVDFGGVLLLILTIGSLQYVLDQGQQQDWFDDSRIVGFTCAAVLGAIGFVWWELTRRNPIVDVRVLRYRAVAIASLTAVATASGIYGAALLLPQFTVDQLGFTSTQAGMLIGARALPLALLTIPIGRLANAQRIDLRVLIGGGLFIAGAGLIWLSGRVTMQRDLASFLPPLMLCGFGIAFIYSPLLVATLRAVPAVEGPKAAAFVMLSTQLGGSASAASLVALTDRRIQVHQSALAGQATLAQPAIGAFLQGHSVTQLASLIASQSVALAYADAMLIAGCLGVCFSPFVALLAQKRRSS